MINNILILGTASPLRPECKVIVLGYCAAEYTKFLRASGGTHLSLMCYSESARVSDLTHCTLLGLRFLSLSKAFRFSGVVLALSNYRGASTSRTQPLFAGPGHHYRSTHRTRNSDHDFLLLKNR